MEKLFKVTVDRVVKMIIHLEEGDVVVYKPDKGISITSVSKKKLPKTKEGKNV